jgi:hypothetical protein
MDGYNEEFDRLRAAVSCATVLEWVAPGWRLDKAESTRRALKYRGGPGQIVIVNHEGQGWWDPYKLPTEPGGRGNVFSLVRRLDPTLSFAEVRKVLRGLVGIAPTYPASKPPHRSERDAKPPAQRWESRRRLRRDSPPWRYLTAERGLPSSVLEVAADADAVREGAYGSAWFAHRGAEGAVTHVEIRGSDYKGSLTGGTKTLFRLVAGNARQSRLVLTEGPIDALSVAAIEGLRADTLYAATGGGMGPDTIVAIKRLLTVMALLPGATLCCATDANRAGDRYAAHHAELATAASVSCQRLRPPEGSDWNDVIKEGRGA